MKRIGGFSDGHHELIIKSHGGLFYLFFDNNKKYIARSDNKKHLLAYIDGYSRGWQVGYQDNYDKNKEDD